MHRNMWILAILLTILALASIWQDSVGARTERWKLCKESLVSQIFTGKCTLVFENPQASS